MDKLEIEIKMSGSGNISPWHSEIAHKLDVPLICTDDVASFIKIGENVYRIERPRDTYRLYKYLCDLEEKNDNGELSDEETLKIVDDIVNNRIEWVYLMKCEPLSEFRENLLKRKEERNSKSKN